MRAERSEPRSGALDRPGERSYASDALPPPPGKLLAVEVKRLARKGADMRTTAAFAPAAPGRHLGASGAFERRRVVVTVALRRQLVPELTTHDVSRIAV